MAQSFQWLSTSPGSTDVGANESRSTSAARGKEIFVCLCLSVFIYVYYSPVHKHTHTHTHTHTHGIVLRLVVHAIAHIGARTCSRQGQAPLNRLETCCRRLPCRRRRRRLRSRQYAAQQATYSMMSSALRPHCCQYEWDSRAQPVGMGGVHYTLHTAHCTLHLSWTFLARVRLIIIVHCFGKSSKPLVLQINSHDRGVLPPRGTFV